MWDRKIMRNCTFPHNGDVISVNFWIDLSDVLHKQVSSKKIGIVAEETLEQGAFRYLSIVDMGHPKIMDELKSWAMGKLYDKIKNPPPSDDGLIAATLKANHNMGLS